MDMLVARGVFRCLLSGLVVWSLALSAEAQDRDGAVEEERPAASVEVREEEPPGEPDQVGEDLPSSGKRDGEPSGPAGAGEAPANPGEGPASPSGPPASTPDSGAGPTGSDPAAVAGDPASSSATADPGAAVATPEPSVDGFDTTALFGDLPSGVNTGAGSAPAGDTDEGEGLGEYLQLDSIDMLGVLAEDQRRAPGSVHMLGEEELETFDYDDANRVLLQAPGVYVRGEDGYGLRPNIGLRGASSDRSKKVTLMEDGVLFGPAPYSAPAAYYFPLMTRMVGVEVFKGPSSIQYGPQTIGGAVNLVSRSIPEQGLAAGVDSALGDTLYGKGHSYVGYGTAHWGMLAEGVHVQTEGFKELPEGGDTGFSKSELNLSARVNSNMKSEFYQRLILQMGLARERSNETYLGLTDADYADNPLQRYPASQLDQMNWWRSKLRLDYILGLSDDVEITTVLYRHDFDRLWDRVDHFARSDGLGSHIDQDIASVLALSDPAGSLEFRDYYGALRGADPDEFLPVSIVLAGNQRRFLSQGVQSTLRARHAVSALFHELELGVRMHQDRIAREHSQSGFVWQSGDLRSDGVDYPDTKINEVHSAALAVHGAYEMGYQDLTVTAGARAEQIWGSIEDDLLEIDGVLQGARLDKGQFVWLLGLGLYYDLTEQLGVLSGVHQGFSPATPALAVQGSSVADVTAKSEQVVNYEAGLRWLSSESRAEAIGFLSDYSNIVGDCGSSAGCNAMQVGEQFDGGEARIWGVELVASHGQTLTGKWSAPMRVAYTYTHATFTSAFVSDNPQWQQVEKGDELPYVPAHQLSSRLGLHYGELAGLDVGLVFVDRMGEQAGQGAVNDESELPLTDAQLLIDGALFYRPVPSLKLYLKADNLGEAQPIVARRPFGARPSKPLLAQAGIRWDY